MWEVKFAKTGEYQKTVNVFNLSGHNSGIYDIAFDKDTSHIATVSKDGTWKIFDTKSKTIEITAIVNVTNEQLLLFQLNSISVNQLDVY